LKSLRIIPENSAPSKVNSTSYGSGAPSVPALHDSLRNDGPLSMASNLNDKHPLQARLEKWEETQFNLKMEGYRRNYGPGEPIRRTMELEVVKATNLIPGMVGGPSTVHEDILRNKSTTVSWEEIYPGLSDTDMKSSFHAELEKRMGI